MPDAATDLSAVRAELNNMTDRILMRLHDRSGFPLNRVVYERGGVEIVSGADQSFLELGLEGLEAYHALLGRYQYPDQHRLMSAPVPEAVVARVVAAAAAPDLGIGLRDELVPYYIDEILPRLCAPGEDASTFGETVYVDADTLELLNERIHVGRKVAQAKIASQPELMDLVDTPAVLIDRLRDRTREEEVLADVERRAGRYEVDEGLARTVFAWVIERTIELEVTYLRGMRGTQPRD